MCGDFSKTSLPRGDRELATGATRNLAPSSLAAAVAFFCPQPPHP